MKTPKDLLRGVPALVLAAGFGTRMRPFTEHVPKPAIPVLGRPLVGHPLIQLYASGCHEVHVNVFHQPERLQASLDPWVQRRLLKLKLRYSIEAPHILGTGGALRRLQGPLTASGGPFLLLNGDSILGLDLADLWAAHQRNRAQGALATLLVRRHRDAADYGAVRVDEAGRILDLAGTGRRPGASDEAVGAATPTVFCGVHVIEPQVIAALPPDGTESCIVRQGYGPLLSGGADVRAHLAPDDLFFHDVGTPARYLDAQAALLSGGLDLPVASTVDPAEALFQEASYAVDARGREYGRPDAVAGLAGARLEPPFFFGPANRVEPGARIGPYASLGAANVVSAGARVEDAALWAGVEVADGERLSGVIASRLAGERVVVDARPN